MPATLMFTLGTQQNNNNLLVTGDGVNIQYQTLVDRYATNVRQFLVTGDSTIFISQHATEPPTLWRIDSDGSRYQPLSPALSARLSGYAELRSLPNGQFAFTALDSLDNRVKLFVSGGPEGAYPLTVYQPRSYYQLIDSPASLVLWNGQLWFSAMGGDAWEADDPDAATSQSRRTLTGSSSDLSRLFAGGYSTADKQNAGGLELWRWQISDSNTISPGEAYDLNRPLPEQLNIWAETINGLATVSGYLLQAYAFQPFPGLNFTIGDLIKYGSAIKDPRSIFGAAAVYGLSLGISELVGVFAGEEKADELRVYTNLVATALVVAASTATGANIASPPLLILPALRVSVALGGILDTPDGPVPSSGPANLTALGDVLAFTAYRGPTFDYRFALGREPWILGADGTPRMMIDLMPGIGSSSAGNFMRVGNRILFDAVGFDSPWDMQSSLPSQRTPVPGRRDLYAYEISTGRTSKIATNLVLGNEFTEARWIAFGNRILFAAARNGGFELWSSNGLGYNYAYQVDETYLVKDIVPGAKGSDPRDFVSFNNRIFFTAAVDASGRRGIYTTDGTAAGTRLVYDPGTGGTIGSIGIGTFDDDLAPTVTLDTLAPYTNATSLVLRGNSPSWDTDRVVVTVIGPAGVPTSLPVQFDGTKWSAALGTLPEGTYSFTADATDISGNVGRSPTRSIVVDRTPPETGLVALPSGWSGGPITVRGQATAGDAFQVVVEALGRNAYGDLASGYAKVTALVAPDGTWSATLPIGDGSWLVRAVASDRADNADATPEFSSIVVDRTAPSGTEVQAAGRRNADGLYINADQMRGIGGGRYTFFNRTQNLFGWDTVSYRVTATAPDGTATTYDVPVPNVVQATFSLPPAIADGTWTIAGQAVDAFGNVEATPATVRMLIDTTAPVVTYAPVPAYLVVQDFVLTGTVSLDTPFIDVAADGGPGIRYTTRLVPVDGTWTWRIPDIAEGRYSLTINAEDRTENRMVGHRIFTTVDRTAPVAQTTSNFVNGRFFSGVTATDTASITLDMRSPSGSTSTVTLTTSDWATTKTQGTAGGSWFFRHNTLPEEGTWQVRATATDWAGNTDLAPVTSNVVVDRTAPTGRILETPAFVRDSAFTVSGTATAGDARTVELTFNGQEFKGPVASDGSWRVSLPSPTSDGRYGVTASVRDAAGNAGFAGTASFAVTRDAPVTTIFSIDGQRRLTGWASNAASVALTLTDPAGAVTSATVPVNPQDWSWSYRVPANTGGAWRVAARATGVFGAAEVGGAQYDFTLADRPKARIDAFGVTNALVTGTVEPGSFQTLGVRLTYTRPDGSTFTATTGVQPDLTWSSKLASPPDGAWSVSAVAFDVTSEDGPAAQSGFLVDRTPPETVLAPPPGFFASRDVPVAGTTTGDATQVKLTFLQPTTSARTVVFAPVAADGSWSAVLPNPAEGKWLVDAAALDALGNTDETPAMGAFTVQRAAPTTVINTLLPATTRRNVTVSGLASGAVSVTLTVTAPDGAQTTQSVPVSLGTWSAPFTSLADGAWSFKAAGVSGAGVVDPEGDAASVVVDTVAPQITIDTPAPSTRADDLVLTGSSTAGDTRRIVALFSTPLEYRTITVVPGADGRWSIPVSGMVPGAYLLTAYAYDQVDQSSSASTRWVVDRTAPTSTLGTLPQITRAAVQTISGRMSERGLPGDVEEVTVTAPDGTVSTYTLPGGDWSFGLPLTQDGLWTVAARGTDAAGNVEAVPVTGRFLADRTPPETALRPLPAVIATSTPTIAVDTEPGISRVRMTITTPEGVAAWSGVQDFAKGTTLQPLLYRKSENLIDGTYTIDVAAIDAAGNEDPTPARLTVTVDTTAPRAATTAITGIPLDADGRPTAFVTTASDISISGTADPDAQFVTLNLRTPAGDLVSVERPVAVAGGTGTWSFTMPGMDEGLWQLVELRATDAAGNVTLNAAMNPRLRGMESFAVDRTAPDTVMTASIGITSSYSLAGAYAYAGSGQGWGMYANALANETSRVRITVTRPDGTVIDNAPFVGGGNDADQDGVYTITATAMDAAGNADATPAVVQVTVDHTAPVVAFDPLPAFTRDTGFTLSGTVSPDATRIDLTVNGAARTIVPVEGAWSITLAELPEAEIVIRASAVDLAGNVGASASTAVVIDRTPPQTTLAALPDTNGAGVTVTGTAYASGAKASTVRLVVTRPTGQQDSYDVATNADGSFSGVVELPEIGGYAISAAASDVLGNTDATPAQRTLQVIRGGPAVVVTDIAETEDRLALRVTGTLAAAGAAPTGLVDLTYVMPDQSLRTARVAAVNGVWTTTLTLAGDGDYVVIARAEDVLGNRNDGDSGLLTVDRTAPRAPVIGAITPDTGVSATDRITSQPITAVTVTAEAGTTVRLSANGTLVGTGVANGAGTAVITLDTPLGDGSWTLRASATDAVGNTSPASAAVVATRLATAAVPTINYITPDTGASVGDGITAAAQISVIGGSAGPGSQVVISAGGVVLGTQTTSGGFYAIDLGALPEGSYPLVATQTDPAGNLSSPSATFNLVVDRSTPAPVLRISPDTGRSAADGVTSSALVNILGTAEPGSTITLYRNGAFFGTPVVQPDGTFTDNAFLTAPATEFTAVAIDRAGNVAGSAPLTVTLDQAAPALTGVAYRDETGAAVGTASLRPVVGVTGTSEPGAQVVLRQGTKVLGTAVVAPDGSFSLALDAPLAFAGTYDLLLQATDAAGNASATLATTMALRSGLAFAAPAQSPTVLPGGSPVPSLVLADWTGDGVADALLATADGVRVRQGNGVGGFTASADILLPFAPSAIAVADLDKDGLRDLVAVDQAGTTVLSLRSDGSVLASLSLGSALQGIALGDVDGDGTPDLLALEAGGAVSLRAGLGDGSFAAAATVSAPDAAAIALADITGDGMADLVLADRMSATVTILAGDGAGTFTLGGTVALGAPATTLAIADFNRDGRADLATLENGAITLRLAAAGGFGVPATLHNGVAGPLASADLDGDTRPDLAAIVAGPDLLAFLNTSAPTVRGVAASIADGTLGIGGTVDLVLGFSSEVKVAGGAPLLRLANGGTASFVDGSGTNALRFRYVVQPGEDTADLRLAASGALVADGAALTDQYGLAAADAAGADGLDPAGLLAVDATVPARPVISGITPDTGVAADGVTTSGALSVLGTAEAGSTVRVLAGETLLGTGTADGLGAYTIALGSALPEGAADLTVQVRDKAGNASLLSAPYRVTVDQTAPAAPLVAGLYRGGNLSGSLVNAAVSELRGTAEPFSAVQVSEAGKIVGTGTADAAGAFRATVTLSEGSRSLSVAATDAAGNVSPAADFSATVDLTIAPPVVEAVRNAFFSSAGTMQWDLTGRGEPGATITINRASVLYQYSAVATVGTDGTFSAVMFADPGRYDFQISATDPAFNRYNGTIALDFDAFAPAAPIIQRVAPDGGDDAADGITHTGALTVSGLAEPGSTVRLTAGGALVATGTADPAGQFALVLAAPLAEGVHALLSNATDAAGNVSGASAPFVVTVDSTAPDAPTVLGLVADPAGSGGRATASGNVTLQGVAEPYSTVRVRSGSLELGSGAADPSGRFALPVTLPAGLSPLTLTATDAAGNVSGAGPATVAAPASLAFAGSSTLATPGDGVGQAALALGDWTGDGVADLVVAGDGGAFVLRGDGTGAFAPFATLLATPARGVALGDLDGDGAPDAAILRAEAGTVTVRLGSGGVLPDLAAATAIGVADVTGDGAADLVVLGSGGIATLRLAGGVAAGPVLTATPAATGLALGDLDGDGVADLALIDAAGGTVTVRIAARDGSFQPGMPVTLPGAPVAVRIGDATGDGFPDVALATQGTDTLVVLPGNGTGALGSAVTLRLPIAPTDIRIADVTGDDVPDLLAAAGVPSFLTVAPGNGAGGFHPAVSFAAAAGASGSLAVGDTNGDGRQDAVLAQGLARDLGVLLSAGIPGVVGVARTPLAGLVPAGTTVTFQLRFSAPVAVTGAPLLRLASGHMAALSGGGGTRTLSFATVLAADTLAAALVPAATAAVDLAGGTITDLPGTLAADLGGADGVAPASAVAAVPAPPTLQGFAPDTAAGDGITAAAQVELRGTAEAGATILALVDGVHVATGQADATGAFRVFLPVVAEGSRSLGAIAVGRQGGISDPATPLAVVFDRTAPASPTLAIAPDTGAAAGDAITATGALTVSGTAEPFSTVALHNGDTALASVTADATGRFSSAVLLTEGTHTLRATATDAAGNVSAAGTLAVRVDTTAPDAPSLQAIAPDTGTAGDRLTNTGTLAAFAVAEPGSVVSVFKGATLLGTATAGTDGGAWVPLSPLAEGAHSLTATATDAAGNVSAVSAAMPLRVDLTAPAAPAIQGITPDNGPSDSDGITNDGAITLVGTAEPGALVEIRSLAALNVNGDTFLGTGQADSDGVFRVPVSLLVSRPSYDLTATATDAAGNASAASASYRVAFSIKQPPQPSIGAFEPDTGIEGDNITSTGSVTLRGSAWPGTTVLVRDGAGIIAQGYADPTYGGAFAIPLVLGEGKHALSVLAQDIGGSLSTPSGTLVMEVDKTAPSRPVLGGIAPDTGGSAADAVTRSVGIAYTGTAEPFARVSIYNQSGLLGEGTADATGAFTVYPLLDLAEGSYATTAVATDRAGNASLPSVVLPVVIDTTAPAAPAGLSVTPDTGASATDGVTGSGSLTLRGTAEAGSLVRVLGASGAVLGSGTAATDGSFAVAILLPEGAAALTATATDAAGNASVASAALQVRVDLSAPAAPVLSGIAPDTGRLDTDAVTTAGAITLLGTAEAGSTVRIAVAGTGTVASGQAGADGSFAIPLLLAEGETRLTATATDAAGNGSAASAEFAVTVDQTAPAAPGNLALVGDRGAPARDGTSLRPIVRVTGTAEPGALATVSLGGAGIGQGLADSKGQFSVALDHPLVLAGKQGLSVTATDAAGNVSAAADTAVTLRTALGFAAPYAVGVAGAGFELVPEQVLWTATLDWNGDGRTDLAVATALASFDQPYALDVLLGDGAGGFQPTLAIPLFNQPLALAASDAGAPRLLVSDFGALRLFTGNGTGGIASAQDLFLGDASAGIALADLDADGQPDILAWGSGLTWASAASAYGAASSIDMGSDLRDVTARDLDGDAITDLAALDRGSQALTVRLGLGGGLFGDRTDLPLGAMPLSLAVADATGDGRPDLLAGMEDGRVLLLPGLAGGGFAAPRTVASAEGLVSLRAADLNGDGAADLLAGLDTAAVQVWVGDGSGGFARGPVLEFGPSANMAPPVVADIDGDGRPDLVSGSQAGYDPRPDLFSGALGVLRNTGPVSLRSVAAVPPAGAPAPGDVVEIALRFTAPVALAGGTPRLHLANGATAQFLDLAGDTMRFRYVVNAGDDFSAFALAGTAALDLGGGVLTDLAGGTAEIAAADGAVLWQDYVPCYVPGTRIETARGQVPIEQLAIGDHVRTASGALRPIRWIGRRSYDGRFIAGNRRALPVTIRADAWAPGIPLRDLTVSPLHALHLEGILIEAKDLLNDVSVTQAAAVNSVTYYNIDLGTHDVVLAEGMPAESFVGDESRTLFQNAAEYRALYPDAPWQEMEFCAPRLDHGFAVQRVRERFAQRAGLRGDRIATSAAHMPRGFLDRVTNSVVEGWVQCPDQPEDRVLVEVLMDGVKLGQALANRYRSDLEAAGLGSGRHAFEFQAPDGVTLRPGAVAVRRALDGTMLCCSEGFQCDGPTVANALPPRGAVDLITPKSVQGWIQRPEAPEDRVMVEIVADGMVIGRTLADRYRADLNKAGLGSGCHGFAFNAPAGVVLDPNGLIVRRADDGLAIRSVPQLTRGSLDSVTKARVEGWMQSLEEPDEPVLVQIMMDGMILGEVRADKYRADLQTSGLGNGRHGFVFEPPEDISLDPDRITVRLSYDSIRLRPRAEGDMRSAA